MSIEEKGLDYYLAHPEEADPTDTKLMAQLLAATGEPAPAKADTVTEGDQGKDGKAAEDAKAKADADEKAKLEVQAKADADAKSKDEADGIATPDGKRIIPFSVLKSEQQQRAAAEADAVAARKEAADATAKLEQALKGQGVVLKTDIEGVASMEELDKAIAEVKDEAPWMVPALETVRKLLAGSEARAQKAEDEITAMHTASQVDANKEVGDAIANNPAITLWMSQSKENPALWQDAIDQDNRLRKIPEWAAKPASERLTKVAELVAAVHGKSVLPPGYDPTSVGKPAVDTKAIDAIKAKEIATRALRDAPTAAVTLSDIPGGEALDTDPLDVAEKQSIVSMGSMFMNMSPEKQKAWLSKNT